MIKGRWSRDGFKVKSDRKSRLKSNFIFCKKYKIIILKVELKNSFDGIRETFNTIVLKKSTFSKGVGHHTNCVIGGQGFKPYLPSMCLNMKFVLNPYECVVNSSGRMVVQSPSGFSDSVAPPHRVGSPPPLGGGVGQVGLNVPLRQKEKKFLSPRFLGFWISIFD